MPVSGQGNIEVETELSDPATVDEQTGTLSWQLALAPGTERKLSFGYSVRHPAGERVYVE